MDNDGAILGFRVLVHHLSHASKNKTTIREQIQMKERIRKKGAVNKSLTEMRKHISVATITRELSCEGSEGRGQLYRCFNISNLLNKNWHASLEVIS